jgi:hypothetical protein
MALNPNTIKALFGKLHLADDAAGAVANYSDDVAEDLARLSRYVSRTNANSPTVPLPVKNALQAPQLGDFGIPTSEPSGVLAKLYENLTNLPADASQRNVANRAFANAVASADARGNTVPDPPLTYRLGGLEPHGFDVVGGDDGFGWYEFARDASIGLPEPIPVNGLVANKRQVVPHKNTALGRWFDDRIRFIDPDAYIPFTTDKVKF